MSDASVMDDYAVIVTDHSGNIQLWSRGAEKLFGHTAQEAVGQTLDLIVPATYREQHWKGFRHAMEGGIAAMEGQSFDLPVQCKDGEATAFPATFVLVRDGSKKTIGAMAILSAPASSEKP